MSTRQCACSFFYFLLFIFYFVLLTPCPRESHRKVCGIDAPRSVGAAVRGHLRPQQPLGPHCSIPACHPRGEPGVAMCVPCACHARLCSRLDLFCAVSRTAAGRQPLPSPCQHLVSIVRSFAAHHVRPLHQPLSPTSFYSHYLRSCSPAVSVYISHWLALCQARQEEGLLGGGAGLCPDAHPEQRAARPLHAPGRHPQNGEWFGFG